MNNQKYYHGTSSALKITNNEILPPDETGVIREDIRDYNKDVVYITTSHDLAYKYAIKAVSKFGGHPVVYEVKPDYDSLAHRMDEEYTSNYAIITNVNEYYI